jgi:dipeptidyl aminopeptidase/acylaminoacyl peptidase
MTSRTRQPDDFDLLMAAWMDADARGREPDHLLGDVLARTSRSRPLPAWRLPERWLPVELTMRRVPQTRLAPVLVLAVVLLALAIVAIAVAGSRRHVPPPFGIATNGQISFVRDGKLIVENADGTRSVAIGPRADTQEAAAYSLDGTKIVYKDVVQTGLPPDRYGNTKRFDVVVADADGSHPTVIAHDVPVGNPIWSPDGRWISFTNNDGRVFVAASDGSSLKDLGKVGGSAWTPSWSPDSNQLAVAADGGVLWLVNRDGTGAHPISHNHYAEVGQKGWSADWSPDGTRLVFSAGTPGAEEDLYLLRLGGTPEQRVSSYGQNGVWSPDGSMLAFMRPGIGQGPSLIVVDRDLKLFRPLEGYYGWYMPAWSPDQREVAILDDQPGQLNQSGPPVIAILDASTGHVLATLPAGDVPLTQDTAPDYTLTWQRLAP